MPLVEMKDMLRHAYDHGYAVGAFDLLSLDFLAVSNGTVHGDMKDKPTLH